MEFELEEKITINVNLDEIYDKIKKDAKDKGYEIISIKAKYETKYENFGQFPFGESKQINILSGFEAQAKRINNG